MKMMVAATPRIISEIRKREPVSPVPQVRARISGESFESA